MKVLIGCEESQEVCKAFRELGHEAYSCDLQDCSGGHPEWHIKGDLLEVIKDSWDLMIAHPPCTYLSYAGTNWWNRPGRVLKRLEALEFFAKLWEAPIDKICLENPKGCASPAIAKYSQIIQPYYFGNEDFKTTWLWLKNLPPLVHTKQDSLFEKATHTERPKPKYFLSNGKAIHWCDSKSGKGRAKERSKTFPGIAKAMAEQWGALTVAGKQT